MRKTDNEKNKKLALGIALGMFLGTLVGGVIGYLTKEYAVWLVIGIGGGMTFGAAISQGISSG